MNAREDLLFSAIDRCLSNEIWDTHGVPREIKDMREILQSTYSNSNKLNLIKANAKAILALDAINPKDENVKKLCLAITQNNIDDIFKIPFNFVVPSKNQQLLDTIMICANEHFWETKGVGVLFTKVPNGVQEIRKIIVKELSVDQKVSQIKEEVKKHFPLPSTAQAQFYTHITNGDTAAILTLRETERAKFGEAKPHDWTVSFR